MKRQNFFKVVAMCMLFSLIGFSSYAQSQKQTENALVLNMNDENLKWGDCPDFMPAGCNITVLHGDPSVGNADILFRVPANSDIPMHWHNSAERMVLISGEMEVTYEGETTKTLKPGTYAYGPSKKPHTAKCKDAGPCVLYIGFIGALDAFPGKGD